MRILTNENKSYDLNKVPSIMDDISYCAYESTNPVEPDYYFNPLLFMESFNCPTAVLRIGDYQLEMPLDWSILVCDDDMLEAEMMSISSISGRGFQTLAYNPYHHMVPKPKNIDIIDIYSEVKWYTPKMDGGSILVVPLEDGHKPNCILAVKDANRVSSDFCIGGLF